MKGSIGGSGGRASGGARASTGISTGTKTAGFGGGFESRIGSPVGVAATFHQAEGIRAAASRAGFTTPRIGFEGPRTAGPALTLDRGRIASSSIRTESARPVNTVISGRETGNRLDKASFTRPAPLQDRVPGTGAYAPAEAFFSRSGSDSAPSRELRTLPATQQMPIIEPGRQNIEGGGSSRSISSDQLRSLLGQRNVSGIETVSDSATRPSENVRQPIASPFRVEQGPIRFASRVGDPQRANEEAVAVPRVQRGSSGNETQNQTVAEQPRVTVARAHVVWSTGYASGSPRNYSETGPSNPSPRRLELVDKPNNQTERREVTVIVPDVMPNPVNPTRLAPEVGDLPKPKEVAEEKNEQAKEPINAVREEIGSLAVIQVASITGQQAERRPLPSSSPTISIGNGVGDIAREDISSEQTTGGKALVELSAREAKKAIIHADAVAAEEIAADAQGEKKKKKSLQKKLLDRVILLRKRLVMPIEEPQELIIPMVQPLAEEKRLLLIQAQPDTAVQSAQQAVAADTKLAVGVQATARLTNIGSPSVSVSSEQINGVPGIGTTGKKEQPELSLPKEEPDLDSAPPEEVKHIVAERAKKVSLRLGREAIDSAQANKDDEISGPEVAQEILLRRRGDEKSPIVGQDEDGAFIWRLQMIARFFLATRAMIDFYYKELVSIRPPVTIAKQGEDVTYEQVRLVTDGPKKFEVSAKVA